MPPWLIKMFSSIGTAVGGSLGSNLLSRMFGLTPAERQQNSFNAFEAQKQRDWSESLFNQANEFNAAEAEKSRQFQAEQAGTQWQRGVVDMQAAGINPAVAFGQGGASAMSGATAAASGVPGGSAASGSGRGIVSSMSDMMQLAALPAQLKLIESQAEKNLADAGLTNRNSAWVDRLNQAQLDRIASEIGLNGAMINAKEYDNALKAAQKLQIEKETGWIDRVNEAKTEADKARAARDFAEAAISKLEYSLGHRLSSSEMLAVIDTLIAALGMHTPRQVVTAVTDTAKKMIENENERTSGTTFANPSSGYDMQGFNVFHLRRRRRE